MGHTHSSGRQLAMWTVALAVCVTTGRFDAIEAQETGSTTGARKPVAVVAARSFGALVGGLRDAFESNEQGDLRTVLDDVLKEIRDPTDSGPRGVSARRPLGMMFFAGEGDANARTVTFLPVSNEAKFLVLTDFFFPKRETVEPGLFRMSGGSSTYLRVTRSWAYLGEDRKLLQGTLPDPATLLPSAVKDADYVVHLDVKSIPEAQLKSIRAFLQENSLQSAVRMPGESEASFLRRMHNAELLSTFIQAFIADGYSLTVSAQRGGRSSATVDIDLAATRGSGLDRLLESWLGQRASFGGLKVPGTIFSASVALPLDELLSKNVNAFFANLHDRIRLAHQSLMKTEADKRDELSRSWRGVSSLFKDVEERLKVGGLDFVCRVGEEPSGTLGWLFASRLRGADTLGEWLDTNLPLLVETGALRKWEPVKKRHRGYRIWGAWPHASEENSVFDLFGAEPSFHVALDSSSVVLAFGEHSLPALVRGLDRIQAASGGGTAPLQLDVSVRPTAMMLSELAPKSFFSSLLERHFDGDARLKVELRRVEAGGRARVLLDAGALRNVSRWAIERFSGGFGG